MGATSSEQDHATCEKYLIKHMWDSTENNKIRIVYIYLTKKRKNRIKNEFIPNKRNYLGIRSEISIDLMSARIAPGISIRHMCILGIKFLDL